MYLIEKCVRNNVDARSPSNQQYLWSAAWTGASRSKSILENCSIDEAIQSFKVRTAKARKSPYRLRCLDSGVVLFAKNTNDERSFEKFTIFAVGFSQLSSNNSHQVDESVGIVVPESGGIVVGSSRSKHEFTQINVEMLANLLKSTVTSHRLTKRFNSDGNSGGVFLVTSPINGVLSNSDVGVTFSVKRNCYTVLVVNKFLANESFGNHRCPFSNLMDHHSDHDTAEEALDMLFEVCRHATSEELEKLAN